MLKAVSIVTCLGIVAIYLLLNTLIYPYVCWLKHRPSTGNDDSSSHPTATFINRDLEKFCSNTYQLNLMPMPRKILASFGKKTVRLPSMIRIETKRVFPFPIQKSYNNASFLLVIDWKLEIKNDSYPDLNIDESYELNITSTNRASLFANTYVGVMRGLSTFEQLQVQREIPVPLVISDKPQFIWRGLMLDVARHFIPIPIIQQTISNMQLMKMNVLHLHLSDDQGFRLESQRFPRLHDPNKFYSRLEMKQLIEYARQRAVRIVPEFDMPAHSTPWLLAYPHLASADKGSYRPEYTWGVKNATMDVSRQSTYEFLDLFFVEIAELFPDRYVHIGGDECEPYEWMQSEDIQKFMKKENLLNYQSLQAYFTRRVEKILTKYNRNLMGWDEIIASNLSYGPIIQSWRSKESLLDAVRRGYYAVLSNGFYLDHMASSEFHYNNDLRLVDWMLNKTERRRFLGGEACLWTEYIDVHMVHSRIWPRTAAIAEVLWSSTKDNIECMYDRLYAIDKHFFHPTDEQYMKALSTLSSNPSALKILADVCEPLGLQGRDHTRNYTSQTPLNRFVDIIMPESKRTRELAKMTNVSALYATFLSWKTNNIQLYTNDSDILQLSENLVRLSEIGIRLLKLLNPSQQRQILSSRWFYYHLYVLSTLENQVPEIRLAGVKVVRDLLYEFDPCSFDLIDLGLILFFPIIVIFVQRVSFIRRRILLPVLNTCYCSFKRGTVR